MLRNNRAQDIEFAGLRWQVQQTVYRTMLPTNVVKCYTETKRNQVERNLQAGGQKSLLYSPETHSEAPNLGRYPSKKLLFILKIFG